MSRKKRRGCDFKIHQAEALKVLKSLPACFFDSAPSDPPYGIDFMGRAWDHEVPGPAYWAELLRVMKPGAYLLAFGGRRTEHRLACAIEDSGWLIRDKLLWMYAKGAPKSTNMPVVFDKANGKIGHRGKGYSVVGRNQDYQVSGGGIGAHVGISDEAKQWQGYGTGLKPCWEPIVLAQKPLDGTYVDNIRKWGVGALNIDACRVYTDWAHMKPSTKRSGFAAGPQDKIAAPPSLGVSCHEFGWWPANALLTSDDHDPDDPRRLLEVLAGSVLSRIFWSGKASSSEKEDGLEHMEAHAVGDGRNTPNDTLYQRGKNQRRNTQETVKPVALMRYLVRLSTPMTGKQVIDPFCGSGSTGVAALSLGHSFVGIDRSKRSAEIARARCVRALEKAGWALKEDLKRVPGKREIQQGLF